MSKQTESKLKEQLQRSRENRGEIIAELEKERITIMRDFNTIKEDIGKTLEENRKRTDYLMEQYRKEITEQMKQFQRDIQENKTSNTSLQNRVNESEDRISDLEDTKAASEKERKDLLKTTRMQERIIQHLQDDAKMNNVRLIGINEKEGVDTNDIKRIWAGVIAENFPNMRMQSDIQLTEAHRTPNNINPNKNTPRHIIVKIPDIQQKNRILKAARETDQT